MKRENIIINSIESYPNSYTVHCFKGDRLKAKGVNIDFLYKTFMRANIILTYEELKTDNPSVEEIKDKIIEVLEQ